MEVHESLGEAGNSTQGFSSYVNPGRLEVQLLTAGRSGAAIQAQLPGWFLPVVRMSSWKVVPSLNPTKMLLSFSRVLAEFCRSQ